MEQSILQPLAELFVFAPEVVRVRVRSWNV